MRPHPESGAVEVGAFQEFQGDEGILPSSYGNKNTVVMGREGEFCWRCCSGGREMDPITKIDIVHVEEFSKAALIDPVPELCLRFCESTGADDDLLRAARFVVTHAADQVEGEEGTVEETAGQVSGVYTTLGE